LTRQAIADRTKLSPRVVAAIDDGRIDQLPAGLYARAYLRTYAQAVGVELNLIQPLIDTIPLVENDLETVIGCHTTRALSGASDRAAVAVDFAVVAAISAGGVLACVGLTGSDAWAYSHLLAGLLALAASTLVLYFSLLGATGVGTAGSRLFGVDFVPRVRGPVDGTALLRRTRAYLRSEMVALVRGRIA
jgi:hypothetical protein